MSALIDRLQLRKELCEILKSDYVALLGQRGSGSKTLVKLIAKNESPLPGMKFLAVALPQAEANSELFMKIFLDNLIDASTTIPPQPELIKKIRQTVDRDAESPIIFRLRTVLDVLGKNSATNYLVIVLHALAKVSEQPLHDLLLLLREYHSQIDIPEQAGKKLRFLVVGGARLWNLCCNKPDTDSVESPFNIAKRVFINGLSYQEVKSKFNIRIEQAVELIDLADGVPSLVELINYETEYIDFDDLSSCFEPLENSWNSLSVSAQQALKNLVELSQKFPNTQLDHQCTQIPKIYDSTIWQEAFWGGFLRLRHRKLTWRSPTHLAFIITQAQIEEDVSKSTLLRNNLLERVESLEEALRGSKNHKTFTECIKELLSLVVHSDNVELVPLLEMMSECKPINTIFIELKRITNYSSKQWIKELTNLTIEPKISSNKLIIETVFSRIANDIKTQSNSVSYDSTIPYNFEQYLSVNKESIIKTMNLSGPQRKKLQDALINAFPDKASLKQMLLFELDKKLNEIAGDGNLQNIVFDLIETAIAQNWIEDLINGARNANPGNLSLQAIAEELLPNHYQEALSTPSPNTPTRRSTQQQKILILTAIPHGLRLDLEIREIEDAIRRAARRDLFDIRTRTAVRTQDIRRAIAEEKPQIVHFCGHGLEDGSLLLEDDGGNNKPLTPQGLATLFRRYSDYVKCVLFNACHSVITADAISQHIDYVIGMNNAIGDKAAIVFAQGFYDGLGYEEENNQDVFQKAFDEGLTAIALEDFSQESTPVLKQKF